MKRSHVRLAAGLLVVGLLAAACGDSKSSSSSTTTAGGSGTTAAGGGACDASKPSIKLGALVQLANFAGFEDGIKARIERENKTCIGGRKLEFVGTRDDASDPQKNLDGAKDLVEKQKVDAIIATSAVLLPQTTDYLASKKIPYFGWGFMPGFCGKDSWGYGFNGCLSSFALGVPGAKLNGSLTEPNAKVLNKASNAYSIVLFNSDDDAGKFGNIQYQALWGKQLLATVPVPTQGVTDFTQYVNTVKSKNPDVVVVSTDFSTAIKLKASIIQGGYKGLVVDYTTYIPGLLDASKDTAAALEGGYSNTQVPAAEDGGEGTKQAAADLQAIGKPAFVAFGAAVSYWSVDVMISMYKAVAAAGDVTPDNFRKVTEAGVTYKGVSGGIGTIKYPDGHFNPAPCAGMVQVKGGKYVTAVPFQCYTLLDPPAK